MKVNNLLGWGNFKKFIPSNYHFKLGDFKSEQMLFVVVLSYVLAKKDILS